MSDWRQAPQESSAVEIEHTPTRLFANRATGIDIDFQTAQTAKIERQLAPVAKSQLLIMTDDQANHAGMRDDRQPRILLIPQTGQNARLQC